LSLCEDLGNVEHICKRLLLFWRNRHGTELHRVQGRLIGLHLVGRRTKQIAFLDHVR
jgi:hypothetical protein